MTKPTVFNYQEHEGLKRCWEQMREENKNLQYEIQDLKKKSANYQIRIRILEKDSRGWIPIEEMTPEVDREGYSERILLSFENASFLCIGEYRKDEEGGAFFDCDDIEAEPLISMGLIVNAWMPLPKAYRAEEGQEET